MVMKKYSKTIILCAVALFTLHRGCNKTNPIKQELNFDIDHILSFALSQYSRATDS